MIQPKQSKMHKHCNHCSSNHFSPPNSVVFDHNHDIIDHQGYCAMRNAISTLNGNLDSNSNLVKCWERGSSRIPASKQGRKPCRRFDQMLWSKRWQGFRPCFEAGIRELPLSHAWASWEALTSLVKCHVKEGVSTQDQLLKIARPYPVICIFGWTVWH